MAASREEVFERVKEVLTEQLGVDESEITEEASFQEDLDAASYERLEFLGDSVLELAVARELYERYPDFTEGRLAKIRSHVVSRASCAVVARELGLGPKLAERAHGLPADELER